ncbi:SH2 domain-containing protein 2A isoform X2 [Strix uralensis]|uniref:SH2 domain-containing protein 2A isoform X2 n=1 Tax=Strix uralensis TaxID=36305 RepID=UPI003DA6DC0C
MDSWVPAWPGRGDPTDDDRPLFSTFKPISEDNTASAKPGASATPVQPQGTEQLLGHHDTRSRAAAGARCGEQSILGAHPCPRPLSPSLQVPPGSSLSPPGWSPADGDLQPELAALRARTRLWFEQTQARRLGAEGELPAWFHGFISRREAEQLLQDQPPGCFLVRFSESTVGFVLSYRGRDRCRHFVLDQLPDGRYVILGERSAHAELADLLRHYAAAPITPYHEFLTVPRGRVRSRTAGRAPAVGPRTHLSPLRRKTNPEEGRGPQATATLRVPRGAKRWQTPRCTAPSSRGPPEPGRRPPSCLWSPELREAPPGRLPASPHRSQSKPAPQPPPKGHRTALLELEQLPKVPMLRCRKKPAPPNPPSAPTPSTSSSCASTPTPSLARGSHPAPPPTTSWKSPSPSTPWAGARAPAPALRKISTPRWRWPGRIRPLRFPGGPQAPSRHCSPNPALTGGSSAACPARPPRGGSSWPLPALRGRGEEAPGRPRSRRARGTLRRRSTSPSMAGRAPRNESQPGRRLLRTFTSSFLETSSKPPAQDSTIPPKPLKRSLGTHRLPQDGASCPAAPRPRAQLGV